MSVRIVLVTDRVQLDKQIWDTFGHCGLEPERARSGSHLIKLLQDDRVAVITTVVDKFEAAMNAGEKFESADIVVLVDESHRSHYGTLSAKMQRTLPNACYVGLTGTPLMKRDKSTVSRFGGLIHTYTIRQAEQDKAVVPLFYEGRHVEQDVDQAGIDAWFDRVTEPLTVAQRADLKRKFASAAQLSKAERRVASIALDVATHYSQNWKNTGLKAMLVAPNKASALKYKQYLDETGLVTSELVISAPDSREGEEDADDERAQGVQRFWKQMMDRFGDEKAYNDRLEEDFLHEGDPEILLVVDKLLVGFDAPRAAVLYLTRTMKDHALLQAMARVNRVFPGKDAGFVIDYAGVLENLDRALEIYGNLPDFDRDDLLDTVHDTGALPEVVRQSHAALLDVFREVPAARRQDRETLERFLSDEARREEFYDALRTFLRDLQLGMSSARFWELVSRKNIEHYRADAKGYESLRRAVKHRYQETVDYGAYQERIAALLDRHVGAAAPVAITPLVNVFDTESVKAEVERAGSPGSKADAIASAMEHIITERFEEDPVYFARFGQLVRDAIAAYKAERLNDAAHLQHILELREEFVAGADRDLPEPVRAFDGERKALFRQIREVLKSAYGENAAALDAAAAEAANATGEIIRKHRTVNWEHSTDVQNSMKNEMEDWQYKFEKRGGSRLDGAALDEWMERALQIAKRHESK